ncbi:RsiV family protein [Moraxella cuniculi]|uniref:Protein of uncharacterized function (DUF3298) n=1 Tax=Moraxella cuniculi TaxID=34061 RepID=A0A448GUB5_9GAMM|nr:RsiV family protein [Moraxella cuniculi]VEG12346.1 Protein of uncharacterised function (DUF3298) [Moraxella cuniculi]
MRYWQWAAMCVVLGMMTACADKPQVQMAADVIKTKEQNQSFAWQNKIISTKDNINQKCTNQCPQIEYQLISTPYAWIDSTINKAVLSILDSGEESAEGSPAAKRIQDFYAKPVVNDDELGEQLGRIKQNLDRLAKEVSGEQMVVVSAKPDFLGFYKDLPQMSVSGEIYLGGAHGMTSYFYYVFDLQAKRQLDLSDVVLPNQMPALQQTLQAQFDAMLRSQGADPAEHGQSWEFFVTRNFVFDKDGMEFLYQPYEIAPYVYGPISLRLDKQQMRALIKPQYL